MFFENDFGRFDLKNVNINVSDDIYLFHEIAYMQIRHVNYFFSKEYYLYVVTIYSIPKSYRIKNNMLDEAKLFVTHFSRARSIHTQFE